MNAIELLGYAAAFLTTASFLPQAVSCLRTGRTDGISLVMYALFSAGVALWLGYGLLAGSWPVVAANAVTLVFALVILRLVWRNRSRRPSARERMADRVVGETG